MFKYLFSSLVLCLCLLCQAQKKNVLLIMVDDLKPLLNCYGHPQIISPNIDALAASGVIFTNAHVQQAVCAPSRVSFMTGMRPDHTQVWDLQTMMRDMNPDILTMPQHFQEFGYETQPIGKILHGARNNDPKSWTRTDYSYTNLTYAKGFNVPAERDYQDPEAQAYFQKIGEKYDGDPYSKRYYGKVSKEFKKTHDRPSTERLDVPDDAYADGAIARQAISEMKKLGKSKKPFFLSVGFIKPHLPFVAPEKYWNLYDPTEIDLASFQEQAKNSPGFSYHSFGELKNYSDIKPALDASGQVIKSKQRELLHGYYACVSYVDAQIGLVMNHLKASRLDKNTVVVLFGDHGWHLGDHGIWCKHSNFEQATRTPLIFAGAGIESGLVIASPVELVDVFPTFCELADIKVPKHLHGESLVPILKGKEKWVKNYALSQYPRYGNRMGYALRSDKYRYVAWFTGDYENRTDYNSSQLVAEELYNYDIDPLETKSLAKEASYQQIREEMKSDLIELVWGIQE